MYYTKIDPNDPNSFYHIPENPVKLDFTGCRCALEIHHVLQKQLGFPDYYGKNWAALWDCLRDFQDEPTTIEVYGISSLREKFAASVEMMLSVFKDVEEENENMHFIIKS